MTSIIQLIEAANNKRLETLSDDDFNVLLDFMERKQDGVVRRAAELLTPYVQSIIDGKGFPEALGHPDPAALVSLCEEVLQLSS